MRDRHYSPIGAETDVCMKCGKKLNSRNKYETCIQCTAKLHPDDLRLRRKPIPPLVGGGQGRSDDDAAGYGLSVGACALGILIIIGAGYLCGCDYGPRDRIILDGQVQKKTKGQQSEEWGKTLPNPDEAAIRTERQYIPESQWPESWKQVPKIDRLPKEKEREFAEKHNSF